MKTCIQELDLLGSDTIYDYYATVKTVELNAAAILPVNGNLKPSHVLANPTFLPLLLSTESSCADAALNGSNGSSLDGQSSAGEAMNPIKQDVKNSVLREYKWPRVSCRAVTWYHFGNEPKAVGFLE